MDGGIGGLVCRIMDHYDRYLPIYKFIVFPVIWITFWMGVLYGVVRLFGMAMNAI